MNATKLLSIAALSTLAAFGAHADDGDTSQHGYNFQSTRSVAEVRAEARNPIVVTEGSTGVIELVKSTADRSALRAEAAAALRAGMLPSGEVGTM
jgi:D-serine deaminase-like pyridoxal phosphate-dependent protein